MYFLHSETAQDESKLIKMRNDLGASGYGLYWLIVERICREDNLSVDFNYESLSIALNVEKSIVKRLIEDYGLFYVENDRIYLYDVTRFTKKKPRKTQRVRSFTKPQLETTPNKSDQHSLVEGSDLARVVSDIPNVSSRSSITDVDAASQTSSSSENIALAKEEENVPADVYTPPLEDPCQALKRIWNSENTGTPDLQCKVMNFPSKTISSAVACWTTYKGDESLFHRAFSAAHKFNTTPNKNHFVYKFDYSLTHIDDLLTLHTQYNAVSVSSRGTKFLTADEQQAEWDEYFAELAETQANKNR